MIVRFLVRSLVAVGVGACLGACASSGGGKFVGRPAPATRFTMLSGEALPLEAYRGRTTVILFWAQWCTSSGPVMRRLNDLQGRVIDSSRVAFVAASVDKSEDETKVRERITYQKLDRFEHAFSGNEMYDEAYMAFEGRELPYILILDRHGMVVRSGSSDRMVETYLQEQGLIR